MKLKYTLVAACFLAAVIAFAQESAPEKSDKALVLKKISTLEATNYYDKTMTVTGKVVRVTVTAKNTYIDLDKPYPKSPFSLIIFQSATNQFPDVKALKNKDVEVTGKIKEYHDKPEIILEKSNQVHVVEKKADDAK
jgi:DNA/RNA endonuclease YhcR with UshA esterase domain